LKHGFNLPNGLNSGSAVGLLLDEEVLPYYDLKSFDDLPIPFRCVATDLTTGKEHIFKDGSLAQAMRSTMSIPGVFAPVEHGDQIYSDGAAVNNLPVDVARSMGADIVIAVYLDTGHSTGSQWIRWLELRAGTLRLWLLATKLTI
jgi:NTE family protein